MQRRTKIIHNQLNIKQIKKKRQKKRLKNNFKNLTDINIRYLRNVFIFVFQTAL